LTQECRDCDHVHGSTRQLSPWKWRCLKEPVALEGPPELRRVDPSYRTDPPYRVCWAIRQSDTCEHYAPRRQPKQET
jgi:hypothetical protein